MSSEVLLQPIDTICLRMDRRKAQEQSRRFAKTATDPDAGAGDRIDTRRKDFQPRLSKLIEENRRVLDRLAR